MPIRQAAPALVLAAMVLLAPARAADKDKKAEKKPEPPRVTFTLPLAVAAGTTNNIRIRGQHLASVTELRFTNAPVVAALKAGRKIDVPKDTDASKAGDSQVEWEFAPEAPGTNFFTLVSSNGVSAPHPLLVLRAEEMTEEKEPNGGFKQAQSLAAGRTLLGTVKEAGDVDVFRIEARAGDTLTIEVHAARGGSPLDPLVMLYDREGHILAVNDDARGSADSFLRHRLSADGACLVSIVDAYERGGPIHAYLLRVTLEKQPPSALQ